MSIKRDILGRVYVAFAILCLIGLVLAGRIVHLQWFQGDYWKSQHEEAVIKMVEVEAERGNILTDDGHLLATSLPSFEIRFDTKADGLSKEIFDAGVDSLAHRLSSFFEDQTKTHYKQRLIKAYQNGERYHLVKRKVNYNQLQEMKTWPIFRRGKYKGGMIALQVNRREYPFDVLAQRTIGYTNEEVKVGLEGSFNDRLEGEKGFRLMQKIAGGVMMPLGEESEIKPKSGNDLVTSLDIEMQDVVERALMRGLEENNADHGTAIVMETTTGAIKAIANLGKTGNGGYWEKYNYAIGEKCEPGSTFKLVSMLALLEDGHVSLGDSVDLEKGKKRFYNRIMKDSEWHNRNKTTVQKMFEISSNVGMSKLVNHFYGKDPQKFLDHIASLKLNVPKGMEIKGEAQPVFLQPGTKSWSGVSLPWMSVGYSLEVTPLQLLTVYNAVANDGVMMKPYIVQEIQQDGTTVELVEPEVLVEHIASDQTIDELQQLLKGVVEEGTAKSIKPTNYSIAGKTGTAQIADAKNGYKHEYKASFAGYFPADNPKYSAIVMVHKPTNGKYYGGSVAGPVFKEIADWLYSREIDHLKAINDDQFATGSMPPLLKGSKSDITLACSELGLSYSGEHDSDWVRGTPYDQSVKFKEHKVINGLVPDVTGMGMKDALYLLENAGLHVQFKGRGKVKSQSLKIGSTIQRGQTIILELS